MSNFGVNAWGSAEILRYLRGLLMHRTIPSDATEDDILSLALMARNSIVDDDAWMPKSAVYIGPGQGTINGYDPQRIKIFHDENKKITDIGIG